MQRRWRNLLLFIWLLAMTLLMALLVHDGFQSTISLCTLQAPEKKLYNDLLILRMNELPGNTALVSNVTTTARIIDLGFQSSGEENVPEHVSSAIAKLYQDLMLNGSVVNDQITTAHPMIPNIFHYVRFNQSEMRFFEMLSIISSLKIGGADKILIHANQMPQGRYWDMIKGYDRIQFKYRKAPSTIFGQPVGPVQHMSDLARIQILREYGGIYLDNDCIVVNEFQRLRKHHCVVAKAADERHMSNGILMGTKDCVLFQMVEELYRIHYVSSLWFYNGGELPQYAILDKYPAVAYLADEGVQQGMANLMWGLDLRVENIQKYWRIVHIYYRHKDDTIDYDEYNIKTVNNTFACIARWLMFDHPDPIHD